MRIRDVADMNVIAHAGSVGRFVVGAKLDGRSGLRSADHQRNAVGFGMMRFANLACGIRTCRIEIAQRDPRQTASGPKIN